MANIEIKDSKKEKLLKALKSQAFLNILGLAARKIIIYRTRKGLDVEGKSFQPYSESYKKVRQRARLPVSPVTLTFEDIAGMLKKIDHVVANDFSSVAVMIDDAAKEQIARYHNIEGAGKKKVIRRFWGIRSASDIKELATEGYEAAKNILKRL
jgi:hypothetical protein